MSLRIEHRIGKLAMQLALFEEGVEGESFPFALAEKSGYQFCKGKVGSMDAHKVVAAIETAAKKEQIIDGSFYRETHALYHAIIEAMQGVTRGQVQLGTVLRTVGLNFAIIRGKPYDNEREGEWIAVALYGTIGAPVRGLEHETLGLGINHI
ncbi:hut operon transcriptional regulator HutP [Aneurinibacillus aneurinilyticus]|uniref:Hut operon positive regulatory protein n=2 Tax=Aneurinibacillus aneurinilyticus TaxID=1391 RepID=A0A848D337_ANEAE|nr:hut operon transcriptional regulator HutP [Aneurinibacillus aneurinilyticus]MCI1693330.1 hut operon transcriptional regulator HutP [Aneurinibacillus aneurinilyticus]MED0671405.1 hut operon transcriptional regulator HutP [Aneurinibacillus aneurinilyticus]MED0707507.1 hut operon transcriptional regulator HutP [Aneurinibacillus aneurinilyticus]MED0723875.1 hut operon transcriptional regulator HutP [Aneurinibacillus aneurinilyticus]MED0731791.1 hut operon transcriptional regulator HutP [Aneurin